MTERSAQALQRDAASGPSWLALALILIGFPIAAAHLVWRNAVGSGKGIEIDLGGRRS